MKRIPLTQGKEAIVDDADFEWLSQWKWCASKAGRTFYAVRGHNGGRTTIAMHRVLCKGNPEVDHRNGNGLDNRRRNLRSASRTQNARNLRSVKRRGGTSRFKGVSFDAWTGRWIAMICADYKQVNLGRFTSQRKAALAYDVAAKRLHGEFARLNFGGT